MVFFQGKFAIFVIGILACPLKMCTFDWIGIQTKKKFALEILDDGQWQMYLHLSKLPAYMEISLWSGKTVISNMLYSMTRTAVSPIHTYHMMAGKISVKEGDGV